MKEINFNESPVSSELIRGKRSGLELMWKFHCTNIGKTALVLFFASIVIVFIDQNAIAILLFAIVSAIVAIKVNIQWLIIPLVAFYGLSMYYDGNNIYASLIASFICLFLSFFIFRWLLSTKKRGDYIKEERRNWSYSEKKPEPFPVDSNLLLYCNKVIESERKFTKKEFEEINKKTERKS